MDNYPIDRILFEATEFCKNRCYFCYGDYSPKGKHMALEQFETYIRNLIGTNLVAPNALLILFGGEFLNHPQSTEIFRIASNVKKQGMKLVIITSGKYMEEFNDQVEELMRHHDGFSHWEVSVKDFESFQFGLRLVERGLNVCFRYDYLDVRDLRLQINLFVQNVRFAGLWKNFLKCNPRLVKGLKHAHRLACQQRDAVILQEFYCPMRDGKVASAALTFSCLDRSVMRIGSSKVQAKCSLFHPVYQKAIHVSRDGTIYPCHLPRYKKKCQALGSAIDTFFLNTYRERIDQFQRAVRGLYKDEICTDGCRGKIELGAMGQTDITLAGGVLVGEAPQRVRAFPRPSPR